MTTFATPIAPQSFIPPTGIETTLMRRGRPTGDTIVVVRDEEDVIENLRRYNIPARKAYVLHIAHVVKCTTASLVPLLDAYDLVDHGAEVGLGMLAHELRRLRCNHTAPTIRVFEPRRRW